MHLVIQIQGSVISILIYNLSMLPARPKLQSSHVKLHLHQECILGQHMTAIFMFFPPFLLSLFLFSFFLFEFVLCAIVIMCE